MRYAMALLLMCLVLSSGCAGPGQTVYVRSSSEAIPVQAGDVVNLPEGWPRGWILHPAALDELLRCCDQARDAEQE